MSKTIENSIICETMEFLIEALQNSNTFLKKELIYFAEENKMTFDSGSSRYVLIDHENHFVIKIAINDFGIDQNKTESKYSGKMYVTKVLENYNNVILITPEYEPLKVRIHKFLSEPYFQKSLLRGSSQTNDMLFDIQDDYFADREDAIENEYEFTNLAMENIVELMDDYPQDVHAGNFGIDFQNKNDMPIMIDTGMDEEFVKTHEEFISKSRFETYELLDKLFENKSNIELLQKFS